MLGELPGLTRERLDKILWQYQCVNINLRAVLEIGANVLDPVYTHLQLS